MLIRPGKALRWLSALLLFAAAENCRPVTAQQRPAVTQKSQPLLTLPGCTGQFYRIALSPDRKRIACPRPIIPVPVCDFFSADRVSPFLGLPWPVRDLAPVQVRDTDTGKRLFNLMGHARLVSDLAFSPDGKRLASASWDETARLWDANTGRHLLTLRAHSGRVNCVAFSPDSRYLATGGEDDPIVKVWDVKTGKEVRSIGGQAQGALHLTYSPDGRRMAVGGLGGFVKVWDTSTGKEVATLQEDGPAYVYGVAFSPDSKRIASAAMPLGPRTHAIKIWDAATGQRLLSIHTDPLQDTSSVAFSPDGQYVASGTSVFQGNLLEVAGMTLWDAATGKKVLTVLGHDREVDSVVFSSDGKRLVSASADGTVKVWDIARLLRK